MAIIRLRLTDFHNIHLTQEDIDFAIPYLDEDIPFCVDPLKKKRKYENKDDNNSIFDGDYFLYTTLFR